MNFMVSEKVYGPRDHRFRDFIRGLLQKTGLKTKYIEEMTTTENMALYARAFTHVSIHPEQNYEFLEILGDVTCNKIVVWYIKDRFPVLQNTAGVKVIARLRINLVSKKNFSVLAENLGFADFISYDKADMKEQKWKSLLEDVLEAFFGATEMIVDAVVHPGAGYGVCFRLLRDVLDGLPISLRYEDLYDPITRLKETFDHYRPNNPGRPFLWGCMLFENTKTEKGQLVHLFQNDKATNRKKLLATAEAPLLDDAKQLAATQALQKIEKEGFHKPVPEYYSMLSIS
jgi:dsRNA-specific ribonuclease